MAESSALGQLCPAQLHSVCRAGREHGEQQWDGRAQSKPAQS